MLLFPKYLNTIVSLSFFYIDFQNTFCKLNLCLLFVMKFTFKAYCKKMRCIISVKLLM